MPRLCASPSHQELLTVTADVSWTLWEQILVKFESKYNCFHTRKWIWKYCPLNVILFWSQCLGCPYRLSDVCGHVWFRPEYPNPLNYFLKVILHHKLNQIMCEIFVIDAVSFFFFVNSNCIRTSRCSVFSQVCFGRVELQTVTRLFFVYNLFIYLFV